MFWLKNYCPAKMLLFFGDFRKFGQKMHTKLIEFPQVLLVRILVESIELKNHKCGHQTKS
jgi:hypothetical protein